MTFPLRPYQQRAIDQIDSLASIAGSRVLLVGCGYGEECDAIAELEPSQLVGVDLEQWIGCRSYSDQPQFMKGSARELPFADEAFDDVLSIAALEHILQPAIAVAEMVRYTKPGGLMYCLAAPIWNSPYGHHMVDHFPDEPWIHLQYPTPETMKAHVGDRCSDMVNKHDLAWHIDYIFSESFNREPAATYQELANSLEKDHEMLWFQRMGPNRDHELLLTEELRSQLVEDDTTELLTVGFEFAIRKQAGV